MSRVVLQTCSLIFLCLLACSQEPYELDPQSVRELHGALPDDDASLLDDINDPGHELAQGDVAVRGPLVGEASEVAPRPASVGVSVQALEFASSSLDLVKQTTRMPQRTTVQLQVTWTRGGDPSVCTGTLIQDDAVLTAAHCLWKASRGGFAYSIIAIPAARGDSHPYGEIAAKRSFVPSQYRALDPGPGKYPHDYGVLRLKKPFSLGTRSLGVEPSALNRAITVRGYPGIEGSARFDGTQMFESRDRIRSILSNGVLYHRASTEPGMSGAGIDDGVKIIGVHCSSVDSDNSGVVLSPSRVNAINAWATQAL